jgi:hypothetical protein
LPPAFTMVSCSTYSSTMKMEAICSEPVDIQRRYILEDRTLHGKHKFTELSLYTFWFKQMTSGSESSTCAYVFLEVYEAGISSSAAFRRDQQKWRDTENHLYCTVSKFKPRFDQLVEITRCKPPN